MSNQPTLASDRQGYLEWLLATAFLWITLIVLFSPMTAGLGWYLERRRPWERQYPILLSLSLLWGLVLSQRVGADDLFSWQYWLASLPLSFMASGAARGILVFSHFLKPKTLQEYVEEQERITQARSETLSRRASTGAGMPEEDNWLSLGRKLKGDRFPDHLGIRYQRQWVMLNEDVLDQHLFVLGATGAGKSETIKRLALEILARTDRDIYLVDGKGDEDLARDIRALAFQLGRGRAPVFKLGFDRFGAVYDGFRGQPADVYNRLAALVGVSEAEGNAAYYADINRDLLQLICFAPGGPPRNFEELRARLTKRWLMEAYRDDPVERQTLEQEIKDEDILGLARRIRPLAREFSPCIGDDGFALEDSHCAVFSMRVQSVGDTSRRFLDFLVEDLKDFVGKRQRRPAVLIIDEFGQFSNNNIIALLTLARSAKLGVILATQDTASLKDEETKKNVLANTRTKILMATDFPEEVGELAGTMYQVESSMQHEDGAATGVGSARVQHAFKVDMNEAAKLQPGEAFLIRQRHQVKVKVHRIGQVEWIQDQEEEKRRQSVPPAPTEPERRPPSLPLKP